MNSNQYKMNLSCHEQEPKDLMNPFHQPIVYRSKNGTITIQKTNPIKTTAEIICPYCSNNLIINVVEPDINKGKRNRTLGCILGASLILLGVFSFVYSFLTFWSSLIWLIIGLSIFFRGMTSLLTTVSVTEQNPKKIEKDNILHHDVSFAEFPKH